MAMEMEFTVVTPVPFLLSSNTYGGYHQVWWKEDQQHSRPNTKWHEVSR